MVFTSQTELSKRQRSRVIVSNITDTIHFVIIHLSTNNDELQLTKMIIEYSRSYYRTRPKTIRISYTRTHVEVGVIDDYLLSYRIAQPYTDFQWKNIGYRKLVLLKHGMIYIQLDIPRYI